MTENNFCPSSIFDDLGSPADVFLQGCIRNPTVNGQRLQYLSVADPQPGLTVSRLNVQTGCNSVDVCNPDPCPVTAFCVDLWNEHRCDCKDGWEGTDCAMSVDDCIGKINWLSWNLIPAI